MSFRDYIKRLIHENGITCQELATRLNVSRQTISNWLKNPLQMSASDIAAVAVELELSPEQIGIVAERIVNFYEKERCSK